MRVLVYSVVTVVISLLHTGRAFSQAPAIPESAPTPSGAAPKGDASAGDAYQQRAKTIDDEVNALLDSPEIPATFVLGLSTDIVKKPSTIRDVTGQVSSFFGTDGELKTGIAVEVAPARLFSRGKTVDEWLEASYVEVLLDSIRVSLATAEDPSGDTDAPALVAVGLRVSLLDTRDYRRRKDVVNKVRDALAKRFPAPGAVTPGTGDEVESHTQLPSAGGSAEDELAAALGDLYKALETGQRLELAIAATATTSGPFTAGSTASDFRTVRAWLAYERAGHSWMMGGALDVAVHDDDDVATADTKLMDFRAGVRAGLKASRGAWDLSAGYSSLGVADRDARQTLLVGTTVALQFENYGSLHAGLQGLCDDDGCDAYVLVSFTISSEERPVFRRAARIGGK